MGPWAGNIPSLEHSHPLPSHHSVSEALEAGSNGLEEQMADAHCTLIVHTHSTLNASRSSNTPIGRDVSALCSRPLS